MNSQWREFLDANGARIEGARVASFERDQAVPKALDTDILCDLSHEAVLKASGSDALAFLQGQLSTDPYQLNAQTSQLSAYHSPQGRVLAVLRLFVHEDGLSMALPVELRETVQKRLSMFVLRAKVAIEDVSATHARFGLAGPRSPELLAEAGWPVPAVANEAVVAHGVAVIRLHGTLPRFQCHGAVPEVSALWQKLAAGTVPVGESEWSLRKILAGVPTIYPVTQDHFMPQMLNLHELDAIDFRKGCYTGQEVIARLQYRGTLKRRLVRGRIAGADDAALPGAVLCAGGAEQPAGEVLDAQLNVAGGADMLAVVRTAVLDRHAALCLGVQGADIEWSAVTR